MKGIILFFFSTLTELIFPQNYNFRNFKAEQGLAQSCVYSITQDASGYLWAGTGNGLSRYNGFSFKNYTISDSLADNFITCSINNGDYLWFGHMNGRITSYNGRKFQTVNTPKSDNSPITHFAESPDGQIWVSSYSNGLLQLTKEKGVVKHYSFKQKKFIISFDFIDNRELLIGTNIGLLYCKLNESGEIEIIQSVAEIPDSKITSVQKMRGGPGFYIATENDGIFQLTNENKLFKVSKIITDPPFDFTGVQNIFEDSQLNLWIASFGNGLIKIISFNSGKQKRAVYFNTTNGYITDLVKSVYEDREGNIWSGNYGKGLTQISPKTFSVITFDKPLYGNSIFAIYLNHQYRWIGTENGLVKMDQLSGKVVKFYSVINGLAKDTVTTIYSNDGKELWIGTENNGVFHMDVGKERITRYPIGNGALENSIVAITGKDDQVWIGTKNGLCNINSGTNKMKWYSIYQGGLPHNFINSIYLDRTNKLWVTTRSYILAYILNGKVFKIPLNSNMGMITLGPIAEDADSMIWVGSNGNGIYKIGSDSITNLTVKEGLLSDYCYSLIGDDSKNLWIGHKGGLSRIRTTDFSIKAISHIEGSADNYQFNQNAIAKDQQKKIWFGSDKGIVVYDASMEYSKLQPPVLGITSLKINDEEVDYSNKIILSPGNYKIRIDFLGVSLNEPTLVSYQYKLEGYDQWSKITKIATITYNHLTEGNYKFILKSSTGDGIVSENPLIINIVIKKPFWKEWWFYPGTILFLVIMTLLYIKRREHIFLSEKRILEEKVRERTSEIQSQKNEIELQRNIIDEKNENITASIQYASHIQNAVFPPIELIDKLLPDNFILTRPKDIVSGDFYWLAEKDDKIIITIADCTGHGVPGAFMSLLGITLLNEIVNIQGIIRSDAIVEKLREKLIDSFTQSRKDIGSTNGMDIALCVLDKQKNTIQFTGGMNPLVYIRDGKLKVVKPDRFSVCVFYDDLAYFTMKEIDYRKGDIFYLFTDGYQDQFGGNYDKKYLTQQFYSTLLEICELPMIKQREILESKLNEWMNDGIQTDDITVMGIRL